MEITLQDNQQLYPLYSEDPDGKSYLTMWMGNGRWFFAVMKGDIFTRPYWNEDLKGHIVLKIFDSKSEARSYMMNNIEPNIYLSCGWIITKEKEAVKCLK